MALPDSTASGTYDRVSFPGDNEQDGARDSLQREAIAEIGLEKSDAGRKERSSQTAADVLSPVIIDQNELERAADAIHAACSGVSIDAKTIKAILQDRTLVERKEIDHIYKQKF